MEATVDGSTNSYRIHFTEMTNTSRASIYYVEGRSTYYGIFCMYFIDKIVTDKGKRGDFHVSVYDLVCKNFSVPVTAKK